ncbi:MAG: hypothetical protein LBI77_01680, partial [Puniceicoccales bacterium]|nr:hypothetical protein [Puniceicoccales bacterium]
DRLSNIGNFAGEHQLTTLLSLKDRDIVITKKCFENLQQSQTAPLVVNLFEGRNLAIFTKEAIDFITKQLNSPSSENEKNISNNFTFGRDLIVEFFSNTNGKIPYLKSLLPEISKDLDDFIKQDPKETPFLKAVQFHERLNERLQFLYQGIVKEDSTMIDCAFLRFINGIIKATNRIISHAVAKDISLKYKKTAQGDLLKTTDTSSVSLGAGIDFLGANLSAGINYESKSGAGANSLYEESKTLGISLGASGNISKALEVSGALDGKLTFTDLYFSIEQYLDSKGKIKGNKKAPLKILSISRKELHRKEKELRRNFKDIEGYLKMLGILPIDVTIELPPNTKKGKEITRKDLTGKISVSAKAFESLGFTISKSISGMSYQKISPYLSLLNDDCSPANNLTAKDIEEIIGKKYDFTGKIFEFSQKGSSLNDRSTEFSKLFEDTIAMDSILYALLGDLRGYVSVLQDLAATKNSAEELTKRKHAFEARLSPSPTSSFKGRRGRLGVLKTFIVTVANLRQYADSEEKIASFQKIFLELRKLAAHLEFSKRKKSRKGTFSQESAYGRNNGFSATNTILLAGLTACEIEYTYDNVSGSPILEENGETQSISIKLPLALMEPKVITGINNYLQNWLTDKDEKIQTLKNGIISALGIYLTKEPLDLTSLGLTKDFTPFISCSTKINTNYLKIDKKSKQKPLPGQEKCISKESYWAHLFYQRTKTIKLGAKAKVPTGPVKITGNVSKQTSTTARDLGTNSIAYPLSRFNVWQMEFGNNEKGKISLAWEGLKNNNKNVFSEILRNLAKENSPVSYELQCLYNDNLESIKSSKSKKKLEKKCQKLFKTLVDACKNFSQNGNNYQEALDALDKVLKFNYQHSFLPHFNGAFSLHQES